MKSHISVLIDGSSARLFEALIESLKPHRLDEDSIASIRARHWDYWYYPADTHLDDGEVRSMFPKEPDELLRNSAFVKNLPDDYSTSGIIGRDGTWTDLQDFGWRMLDEPSRSNDNALKRWRQTQKEILERSRDAICVQVMLHC